MRVENRQLKRSAALCLAVLLLAALLCGCGMAPMPANSGPDPEPAVKPTPEPASAPTPDPEALAREQRLSEAKDGFIWDDGYLQAIDDEGNLRTACYVGVLKFGIDGRYTSGSQELDELVANVVREKTKPDMTRMEMLRAMYVYTIDHTRYVGMANYECSSQPAHGKDGWMPALAIKALRDGIGNCYCFAAAFAALARGVGYQAYATGGVVSAMEDPHGWVEILDDDGNIWFCDPETEYINAEYQKQIEGKDPIPDLFYKAPDKIGAETGFSYRVQGDPFAAEAKEAQARRFGMLPAPTPEPTEAPSFGTAAGADPSVPESPAPTESAKPAN